MPTLIVVSCRKFSSARSAGVTTAGLTTSAALLDDDDTLPGTAEMSLAAPTLLPEPAETTSLDTAPEFTNATRRSVAPVSPFLEGEADTFASSSFFNSATSASSFSTRACRSGAPGATTGAAPVAAAELGSAIGAATVAFPVLAP